MTIADSNLTSKRPSQRDRILAALRAAGSHGLTTPELLQAGGFRYSSRLRELRQQGHVITSEPLGDSLFRYTLQQEARKPAPLPDYSVRVAKAMRDVSAPLFAGTEFRP